MPGPFDGLNQPTHTSIFEHLSTGNLMIDMGLIMGTDIAAGLYSGTSGNIVRGAVGRVGAGSMLGFMAPGYATNMDWAGSHRKDYMRKGSVRNFNILRDARQGQGAFRGTTGGLRQRLISKLGRTGAGRLASAASVTLGIRSLWTAESFGLGISLGRGLGDIISNYDMVNDQKLIAVNTGGFFADTRASFTQRQRAIRAIHDSQLTTRAALGNEAAFLHG